MRSVRLAACLGLLLPSLAFADGTGVVTGSNVRLRRAPTVESEIVKVVDRGDLMKIVADTTVAGRLWVRVSDTYATGWIRGDYFVPYGDRVTVFHESRAGGAARMSADGRGGSRGRTLQGNGALLWIIGLVGPTIAVLIAIWLARKPEVGRQKKTYSKVHGAVLLELINNVDTCCYIIERSAVKTPVYASFTTTAQKQMLPVLAAYSAQEHRLLDIYELVHVLEPIMRSQEEASRQLHDGDEERALEAQERTAKRAHQHLKTLMRLLESICVEEYAFLVERLAQRAGPLGALEWPQVCAIGRYCMIQEKLAGDPKFVLSYSIFAGALREVYRFADPAAIVGGLTEFIEERDGELLPTHKLSEWVALTSWSLQHETPAAAEHPPLASPA